MHGGQRRPVQVLLYGDRWAALLERMAERLRQLELKPLLVIASGEAEEVCRGLSALAGAETKGGAVGTGAPGV